MIACEGGKDAEAVDFNAASVACATATTVSASASASASTITSASASASLEVRYRVCLCVYEGFLDLRVDNLRPIILDLLYGFLWEERKTGVRGEEEEE